MTRAVPAPSATDRGPPTEAAAGLVERVTTQHYPMLQRNPVYTGVTRGERLVVLASQKALAIAIRGEQTRRRWSKLQEWLAGPRFSDAAPG